jgi:predicted enzyme related to lactoylglutathione lyase
MSSLLYPRYLWISLLSTVYMLVNTLINIDKLMLVVKHAIIQVWLKLHHLRGMVMSNTEVGTFAWFDLTVPNAQAISAFYTSVVGWQTNTASMGEYDDYSMQTLDSKTDVAGVCHTKGVNQDLPAQWLMYIKLSDLDASIVQVVKLNGSDLTPIRKFSDTSHSAVIKDPAGAVCAIYADIEQDN